MNQSFMTQKEVCDALRLSRPTVSRHTNAGHLKAVKFGGHYRWPSAEVERVSREGLPKLAKRAA